MANSIVGLDIGATGIRAAEVVPTRRGARLVRYHAVPLPRGATQRGEVVEEHLVADALRTLWKEGGFKTKQVVLGIGNDRVIARELTVPKAPRGIIRESLPFQVADMLPVPAADAILDFYPISEAQNGQVNGLLVAAVKDSVLANVETVERARLEPVTVDFIPFALSRVLLGDSMAGDTAALVDVGAHTTTVVIASGGVPHFVRIIPSGGDEVTQALHGRLGIERGEAEHVKRTVGLGVATGGEADEPAVEAIREVTGELVTGVRNTVTYFAQVRPDLPVRRVVLSGDGASLDGFPAALREVLRVPVARHDPFAALAMPEKERQRTAADAARASVALGLAMRSAA